MILHEYLKEVKSYENWIDPIDNSLNPISWKQEIFNRHYIFKIQGYCKKCHIKNCEERNLIGWEIVTRENSETMLIVTKVGITEDVKYVMRNCYDAGLCRIVFDKHVKTLSWVYLPPQS